MLKAEKTETYRNNFQLLAHSPTYPSQSQKLRMLFRMLIGFRTLPPKTARVPPNAHICRGAGTRNGAGTQTQALQYSMRVFQLTF